MHDIHLANQIIKLSKEYAIKNKIKDIKRMRIKLGYISEHGEVIHPENLEFNIKLLLGDIDVEIERIKGDRWELIEIEGN